MSRFLCRYCGDEEHGTAACVFTKTYYPTPWQTMSVPHVYATWTFTPSLRGMGGVRA